MKISQISTAIILVTTLFVCGCSRQSNDTANSQTNQVTSAVAPMVPANQPDMAGLDRVARMWMFNNHRRPTSWEDFAAHAGVQIPPPPPGKKYVLSRDMRVTLVDQ